MGRSDRMRLRKAGGGVACDDDASRRSGRLARLFVSHVICAVHTPCSVRSTYTCSVPLRRFHTFLATLDPVIPDAIAVNAIPIFSS